MRHEALQPGPAAAPLCPSQGPRTHPAHSLMENPAHAGELSCRQRAYAHQSTVLSCVVHIDLLHAHAQAPIAAMEQRGSPTEHAPPRPQQGEGVQDELQGVKQQVSPGQPRKNVPLE